jgi:hypothetical protein
MFSKPQRTPGGVTARGQDVKTLDQPRHGWTTVLRRQPARIVNGQTEGGYTDTLSSYAATVVTIPTWITLRSHLSFSGSAGPTRSRTALPHNKKHVKLHQQPGQRHRPGPVAHAG